LNIQKAFKDYWKNIMAITKRPTLSTPTPEAVERFIQGAPDSKPAQTAQPAAVSHVAEEGEEGSIQITLRIGKAQLARITTIAKRQGIPRASYIKRAIALQLVADETVKG
jgi:predicted DNA binding CopG/RHH family protein